MVALTAPSQPLAADPPIAKNRFIVGPWFDGFFFFGSVAAVFACWIAATVFKVPSFYILAAVAVTSNTPHLISTWTRVYFDRREWTKRPFHIFVMPTLIIGATAAVAQWAGASGQRALSTLLLYYATWHFLQQNWGLLRIYQTRSQEPKDSVALRLERPLLYVAVFWCALHRLKTGPRSLFGWEVFYPDLPWALIHGLLAAALFLLVGYLAFRLRDVASGAPWAKEGLLRSAFVLCAFIGFFVPFILITTDDSTTAFAAAACWHGIQYLGVMRFYHRNQWRAGVHEKAKIISYVSQPGWSRVLLYMALLWGIAGVAYASSWGFAQLTVGTRWTIERWGLVTWFGLTFSHYYLDGIIWKLRKDAQVREGLKIAQA
ncbi:MAG: hypothetical protein ACJ790_09010 [Myxococcaceae bacterium]